MNIFTASKGSYFYILFIITAAAIAPCGGPIKPPRAPIVQIIFLFWSFEISKNIQSLKKVRREPFSKQCFTYLTPFDLDFLQISTNLRNLLEGMIFLFNSEKSLRVTDV